MGLDYRNLNTLWGSILVETLSRLGLVHAVICPGSRSTPLAVAFALHPHIEAIPVLDERSAAFLALGMAKRTGGPTAVLCSSGTAGANFYPALIEARESQVSLLLLTADRPPELRDCHSGQTIDQVKLFGTYPNWQVELMLPSAQPNHLAYLRQRTRQAWERSQWPVPGPVHINLPFRDPLPPIPDCPPITLSQILNEHVFFSNLHPPSLTAPMSIFAMNSLPWALWCACDRGVIVAGPAHPRDPHLYCQAVAWLSRILGWPVLADGLSPLRNFANLNPNLISTYDLILRQADRGRKLQPQQVIQLGPLPTSKVLRDWLQEIQVQTWVIDPSDRDRDPLHGRTMPLRLSIESLFLGPLPPQMKSPPEPDRNYVQEWLRYEFQARRQIDQTLATSEDWIESKIAWVLPQILPLNTALVVANSLAVRDVEWVWPPNRCQIQPYCNRGANGIDGTLSTALGIAHGYRSPATVLLTGDLALLHDTNGFLHRPHMQGHLTILLINNQGGGIFELLPIAQFDPPFETFFATPQSVDFRTLCHSYGVEHKQMQTWPQLISALNPLPKDGIRVLEVTTDRKLNAAWRQDQFQQWSDQIR